MKIIVTIISGGAGSRLWPVSRKNFPKPFIKLNDGESLLQKALSRALNLNFIVEILTVTSQDLFYLTLNEYQSIDTVLPKNFILEPSGKNTAPAIISASLDILGRYGEDALMLILPADQIIQNEVLFQQAVEEAISFALDGKLVAFGITPDSPNTSYGYIQFDGNAVINFIEKPNKEIAEQYILSGDFCWNSGMYCFSIKTFLEEVKLHSNKIFEKINLTFNKSYRQSDGNSSVLFLDKSFSGIDDISIDYALFEKSNNINIVHCNIGWNDVGSWEALTNLIHEDSYGNRGQGEVLFQDTKNSSIYSNKRLVCLLGVNNLIVIETDDAVLVLDKSKSQEVKSIYSFLKDEKNHLYEWHKKIHRPWGNFTVLFEGKNFKVKHILIKPQEEISMQKHNFRSEHWVIVRGIATIINDGKKFHLKENESTYIPQGVIHQIINEADNELEIIEVQSGSYINEDDIIRIKDKYKIR